MPKPRDQYIYIGADEKDGNIMVSGDEFVLPDDGRTYYIFHQREYRRARKPKVVYAIFQFFSARSIKANPVEELRRYDAIFSIDTNYAQFAITTAAKATWVSDKRLFAAKKLFTRKSTVRLPKPEREAWRDFITLANPPQGSHNCLVVDSDLRSLIKFNRREEPLLPGFYLPDEWQLNYATSDASDDFILVRMMRLCDSANRRGKTAEYSALR